MQLPSMLLAWPSSAQVGLLPTTEGALERSGQCTERGAEAGRDGGWEGDTEKWQGIEVDVAVVLQRQNGG
jgi:hypothetical protein